MLRRRDDDRVEAAVVEQTAVVAMTCRFASGEGKGPVEIGFGDVADRGNLDVGGSS